ncbi:MAG TPA: hypothetical protein VLG69_02040 [Candidatus Andersenbacteria bacterium]|nr:hypothetical protein [Candidatus Andersenbacteria bacterium]
MNIRRLFPSSHYALLSLFYFIGMEVWFALSAWPVVLFFIILAVLIIGIVLIRSEEGDRFHPTQAILPTLASFGFTAFAIYLPQSIFLHVYFIGCASIFFFILKYGAKQAWPTWNTAISHVVLFVCLAAVIGWRFYFYSPVGYILAILFPIIVLMAFQSLVRYARSMVETLLLSLAIALVLIEIIWILQFLPLHFIVEAGFIVSLYYATVQIITAMYEGKLSRTLLIELSLAGTVGAIILLSTAHWV